MKLENPLISIIVPCYNVENYLDKCVESLVRQTYTNLEIILVDDGAKDRTPQICDDWARQDSRIKVIHKENGGLVSARNAGYEAATGDWQMYIDGDDWIDRDTCEKLLMSLEDKEDVDIIFWKYVQELGDQSIRGKSEWNCKDIEHIYAGEECIELARHTLIYKSGIATAYCKLIRSTYARQYGIFHDPGLRQGSEGLEFSLRAFYYAQKALYINAYFYHYRYNPNSISKKIDEKNTWYLTDCYLTIERKIDGFKRRDAFRDALYQRVVYVLIAIAMGTYFHPANTDSLYVKCRKYAKVINEVPLYKKAVRLCNTAGMDRSRKLTLLLIRMKLYCFLPIIAWLKQFYLKRGKYNY